MCAYSSTAAQVLQRWRADLRGALRELLGAAMGGPGNADPRGDAELGDVHPVRPSD